MTTDMAAQTDVTLVSYDTREAWLAGRTAGIGASESAALFGLSPWQSAFSLWCEKTGAVPREDLGEREYLSWGLYLEPPIAARYAEVTSRRVWTPPTPWCSVRHPRVPCMSATPDRWVIESPDRDGRGVLQIKNSSAFKIHDWDDGPPDFIQAQVQHELAVTGFQWGSIAVLIGGNTFRHFDLERNDDYIAELEHACVEFWARVVNKEPPAPDGSAMTAVALKRLHPLDSGATVPLAPGCDDWFDEMDQARTVRLNAEKAEEKYKTLLRGAIASATFGALPSGRTLSLRTTEVKGYTREVAPSSHRKLKLEKPTAKGTTK